MQKAQAVAVARVTPLRVNLPTRGLRHSFVQVLQTEVNKPLTITLSAANDRHIGWLRTTLLWAGVFLVLWLIAAVAAQLSATTSCVSSNGQKQELRSADALIRGFAFGSRVRADEGIRAPTIETANPI